MTERRERELVLAPNEFAYILDTTKGLIACYVGPNKTSLAQTDQPVWLNPQTGRFESVELSLAVTLFVTAPANAYVVLDNPAEGNIHPRVGLSNALIDLQVGRRINVPGPTSFALWPGQVAQVIEGHRLKSNEYLLVRIHDADAASSAWRATLGRLPEAGGDDAEADEPERFVVGEKRVIRGSDVRFYLPPTGVEVLPDRQGRRARKAVVLRQLEYCVLVGERGTRHVVRGERVVFPEPDQRFEERDGKRVFRAIELSDTTGLHLKVVADYEDGDGASWTVGQERFLTGDGVVFFPRPEVEVLPGGDRDVHVAVAVPKGEGRYVLHRETGAVRLAEGPCMLLPDPRKEVFTRRVLSDRECGLLYPGNAGALAVNEALRRGVSPSPPAPRTGQRMVTLDGRFDGAVRVEVWSSYAVQIVDRAGARRVVQGPQSVLLAFDEMLQALRLSTGTPKSADAPLHTVFLQVQGNKVSDAVSVVTADLVRARLALCYRVSFEGSDPDRWFAVADYVKLLCDHASSMVKSRCRSLGVRALQANLAPTIRDLLLGARGEDGRRPGLAFDENAMRVYDVEVLDFEVEDAEVAEMLDVAQSEAMHGALELSAREQEAARMVRREEIDRQLDQERHESERLRAELEGLRATWAHTEQAAVRERDQALQALDAELARRRLAVEHELLAARLEARKHAEEQEIALNEARQELALAELSARVDAARVAGEAFQPHLVQALHRLGDQALLERVAENFGELAAVEGRGLLETARRYLDFVPSSLVPSLAVVEPDDEAAK